MAQEKIQPENWGQPITRKVQRAAIKVEDPELKIENSKKRIAETKLNFADKLREKYSKK